MRSNPATNITRTSLHYYNYTCNYYNVTIHAKAALCQKSSALPNIFVAHALCPKSLRVSCCVQKPCGSCAFSKSFALCSKSLRFVLNLCTYLALPKIFALCALYPKTWRFSRFLKSFAQNLCASLALPKIFVLCAVSRNFAVLALFQKALRFAQNLCASLKIFLLPELLSKSPRFYQNPHAFSKHALVWQKTCAEKACKNS
jgi:hypothetical protein